MDILMDFFFKGGVCSIIWSAVKQADWYFLIVGLAATIRVNKDKKGKFCVRPGNWHKPVECDTGGSLIDKKTVITLPGIGSLAAHYCGVGPILGQISLSA